MNMNTTFGTDEITAFMPVEKIALIASKNPEGLPHITLITSARALGQTCLTLGEFCKGNGKTHIQERPETGFLIMTMDRRMWRGKARWSHIKKDGPEYESYNDAPMFRYNSYFGINTVHYLDLVGFTGPEPLPLSRIVISSLLTRLARGGVTTQNPKRILKPFAETLVSRLDALKFLAYVGDDGYPVLVPLIQCQASDSRRLVFGTSPYHDELESIPIGTCVAFYGLTMGMENVLVRGAYTGMRTSRMVSTGIIDIDWVYNSMPPCHGQVYPEIPLTEINVFDL